MAQGEAGKRADAGSTRRAIAERECRQAAAVGAPRRRGRALSSAGVVSGDVARLREAVALTEFSGARLAHAGALTDLGTVLRGHGDREAARLALSASLDIAQRSGAVALASRARRELIASGARPRREALSGPDALTPAESRAVRMAAAGMTNREIAERLFLSAKTVEKHLSQAYLKLGVDGRRGLATMRSLGVELPKQ
ncbi:MAG: helix-turn-helix transcriptional regulator [Solirubrobacteraceae bacterium]